MTRIQHQLTFNNDKVTLRYIVGGSSDSDNIMYY